MNVWALIRSLSQTAMTMLVLDRVVELVYEHVGVSSIESLVNKDQPQPEDVADARARAHRQ